jgi:hypothetical protein
VNAAAQIAVMRAKNPIPYFFIIIIDAFMIQKATKTLRLKMKRRINARRTLF